MGFRNPSVSNPFLASLFGVNLELNKRGGYKITKGGDPSTALFGPGALSDISSYITGTSANPFTSAFGQINQGAGFGALPPELLAPYQQATGTLDELIGASRPVLQSLIQTGNPVDVSRVVQSRYANTILPTIAEQYNPAQGTAFQNIASREASNLIAELEYPAEEAARQRQVEAINVGAPTLAGLSASRLGLPAAALGEASSISQLTDPGGRLLSALLNILQFTQQQSILRDPQEGGGSSGTGELLGSLGSLIGGICWVADELFGPDDIRTILARMWCLAHPEHPFVRRYTREGRDWATWLRHNPWAKPAVEPTWTWMAEQGAAMLLPYN